MGTWSSSNTYTVTREIDKTSIPQRQGKLPNYKSYDILKELEFQGAHAWPIRWGGPEDINGLTWAHHTVNTSIQSRIEGAGERFDKMARSMGRKLQVTVRVERYDELRLLKSATYNFQLVGTPNEVIGEVTIHQRLTLAKRISLVKGQYIHIDPEKIFSFEVNLINPNYQNSFDHLFFGRGRKIRAIRKTPLSTNPPPNPDTNPPSQRKKAPKDDPRATSGKGKVTVAKAPPRTGTGAKTAPTIPPDPPRPPTLPSPYEGARGKGGEMTDVQLKRYATEADRAILPKRQPTLRLSKWKSTFRSGLKIGASIAFEIVLYWLAKRIAERKAKSIQEKLKALNPEIDQAKEFVFDNNESEIKKFRVENAESGFQLFYVIRLNCSINYQDHTPVSVQSTPDAEITNIELISIEISRRRGKEYFPDTIGDPEKFEHISNEIAIFYEEIFENGSEITEGVEDAADGSFKQSFEKLNSVTRENATSDKMRWVKGFLGYTKVFPKSNAGKAWGVHFEKLEFKKGLAGIGLYEPWDLVWKDRMPLEQFKSINWLPVVREQFYKKFYEAIDQWPKQQRDQILKLYAIEFAAVVAQSKPCERGCHNGRGALYLNRETQIDLTRKSLESPLVNRRFSDRKVDSSVQYGAVQKFGDGFVSAKPRSFIAPYPFPEIPPLFFGSGDGRKVTEENLLQWAIKQKASSIDIVVNQLRRSHGNFTIHPKGEHQGSSSLLLDATPNGSIEQTFDYWEKFLRKNEDKIVQKTLENRGLGSRGLESRRKDNIRNNSSALTPEIGSIYEIDPRKEVLLYPHVSNSTYQRLPKGTKVIVLPNPIDNKPQHKDWVYVTDSRLAMKGWIRVTDLGLALIGVDFL